MYIRGVYTGAMDNKNPKAGETYLMMGQAATVTKVTPKSVRYTMVNAAGETVPYLTTRLAFSNSYMVRPA